VFHYRGEVVGSQRLDLVWWDHVVEVKAQSMARGWEAGTRTSSARGTRGHLGAVSFS